MKHYNLALIEDIISVVFHRCAGINFDKKTTLLLGQEYFTYIFKTDLPFGFLKTYQVFKSREGISL